MINAINILKQGDSLGPLKILSVLLFVAYIHIVGGHMLWDQHDVMTVFLGELIHAFSGVLRNIKVIS